MAKLTRRSLLRNCFSLVAAGTLARPYIANAAAATAALWWTQGSAEEEDLSFKKIVAEYEKASGNTIDYSIMPYAPLRQKIVSALIYPALLVVVAALSVTLVLTVVLPQFEPLFEQAGDRLPAMARILMVVGDGLRAGWWAVLPVVATMALAARRLVRIPKIAARRDRLVLSLPIAGDLVRKFEIGRFARTLAVLLENGVPSPRALALAGATIGNRVMAAAVETVASRFKEGEGLSTPLLRCGEFPPLAIQLIEIGEQTGRLEELLSELGAICDDEVEQAIGRLIALLVPAITIAMGTVIALIIVAVMTAMISVNDLAL